MKPTDWMAFYWGKFQTSTPAMRREHKWSYFAAICSYYWGDCVGLPDNDQDLMMICECYELGNWAITKGYIFGEKFKLIDGRWHNMEAQRIYSEAKGIMERNQARVSAATEANPNHIKHRNENRDEPPQESLPSSLRNPPIPLPIPIRKDIERLAEEIYQSYPLRVGKPAALKVIRKQLLSIAPEKLLELTKAYAAARSGDLDFVPHPSTWFNQQRFNDNPETWKPHANKSNTPQRVDRSIGTANEGIAHRYKGLGKLAANRPDQPSS